MSKIAIWYRGLSRWGKLAASLGPFLTVFGTVWGIFGPKPPPAVPNPSPVTQAETRQDSKVQSSPNATVIQSGRDTIINNPPPKVELKAEPKTERKESPDEDLREVVKEYSSHLANLEGLFHKGCDDADRLWNSYQDFMRNIAKGGKLLRQQTELGAQVQLIHQLAGTKVRSFLLWQRNMNDGSGAVWDAFSASKRRIEYLYDTRTLSLEREKGRATLEFRGSIRPLTLKKGDRAACGIDPEAHNRENGLSY